MNLASKVSNQLYQRTKLELNRTATVHNSKLHDFASNNYLGLANQTSHSNKACGAGASVMVSGYHKAQQALEEAIADYLNMPAVMVFASGYQANLGVLQALLDKNDFALADQLCHASILDGLKLSGAQWRRFRHQNYEHLAQRVHSKPCQLVISEGLFSMDGDWLNLEAFAASSPNSWHMVDDAHGFMLRPLASKHLDLYVGTFSKAVGCVGAFVAASQPCIEYLRQFANSHIYSTALPPMVIEQIHHNFQLAQTGERQAKLQRNIDIWQKATGTVTNSPIQTISMPNNQTLLTKHTTLLQLGYLTGAIRRPTVKTPKLRITLSSNQSEKAVNQLAELVMETC
ncbi:aminotransferase class I/II-fold pyridoxal phosphate-dependent enzyme [Salinibius halmophilus]|uniref:aminotransferase class I/II-fold pyridoxal phosphate-dependent enzyme n=1 Tax=Salinibius halmophilus TaxID=1853216 RepID=UPI000E66D441|nr:aminotransferase class I/II-fold pyridoxal phosphate-dependent enzyme [Salinibius halmophilus]